MGTYRGFKTEVIGHTNEVSHIKDLIKADEELAMSLLDWDKNIKGWTPDDKLKELSKQCKDSYILLTTVQEASEVIQTIYYQGVGLNALHPALRRLPPIYKIKIYKGRVAKKEIH